MKKLIHFFLLVGFFHIAYGLYISSWRPSLFSTPQLAPIENKFYDYAGVINVHTQKSTGSGNVESILRAAQAAGLKYVVFTDLNDFNIALINEGVQENVVSIFGGEYSFLDARILNFDMQTTEHLQGPGRSQVTFADLLSQKDFSRSEGLFFLAHPFKPGYKMATPYPLGLNGIEVLNLRSVWQEAWANSRLSFIWSSFLYPFNSTLAYLRIIMRAGDKELELWDELNETGPTYGIYGSDAEARFRISSNNYLEFPSYFTLFSIIKNHLLVKSELTGNPQQDRKRISEALRNGQFYMSADIIENPKGFEAYIVDKKNNILPMGSRINMQQNLELIVHLPNKPTLPFEIIVHKDGEKILTSNSQDTTFNIHSAGVYRVSVRVKINLPFPEKRRWANWILTNPFFIN